MIFYIKPKFIWRTVWRKKRRSAEVWISGQWWQPNVWLVGRMSWRHLWPISTTRAPWLRPDALLSTVVGLLLTIRAVFLHKQLSSQVVNNTTGWGQIVFDRCMAACYYSWYFGIILLEKSAQRHLSSQSKTLSSKVPKISTGTLLD